MITRTGRWLVQTDTSAYVLDFDALTCLRYPGFGGDERNAHPCMYVSELRRDGEAVPLLELAHLAIGDPMVLYLDVRGDGVSTVRRTTPVRYAAPVNGEINA